MRNRAAFCLSFTSLFLSGLGSLVFEVVWTRSAILILGTTTLATTAIFAAFMAGLALGSAFAGRWIPKVTRPFAAYALVTFLTAASGIGVSTWLRAQGVAQLPWMVVPILLLPTLFMGITTPLVIAGLKESAWANDRVVGSVYGINTAGGAFGALVASFWVIPALGVRGTETFAAICLVAAALGACPLWKTGDPGLARREAVGKGVGRALTKVDLGVALWGGMASLALEVVWTRLLGLLLGPSVFALGLVLFVYLLSIGVGSFLVPKVLKRATRETALPAILLSLGYAVGLSAILYGLAPYLFVGLVNLFRPHSLGLRLIELSLSAGMLLIPALLHGVLVPLVVVRNDKAADDGPGPQNLARNAAWVFGANSVGSIVGSVAAGLIAIPRFGFLPILLTIIFFHLGIGLLLLRKSPIWGNRSIRTALIVSSGVYLMVCFFNGPRFWDQGVLASGVYKYAVGEALSGGHAQIEVGKVIYYREGISSTVAVIETKNDRILSIDGKADASIHGDRSTQVLLGALPLSLSKETRTVLVIGLASGVTAGVASLFQGAHVTAVEIEPAVLEASRYFSEVNFGPLKPPEHRIVLTDARHFLATRREKFDVITSEPSNPWMSGVAPLFTREFFQMARGRLEEGGVMCQWLPIYGMSRTLVGSILKTFASVFGHVLVFESVEGYDLLLIGSEGNIYLHPDLTSSRWTSPLLKRELAEIGLNRGIDLLGRFLMGPEGIARFAGEAPLNTDDNAFVEFRAPLSLHQRTAEMNDRILSKSAEGILAHLGPTAKTQTYRRELAERFRNRGEDRLAEMVTP